jgi:hypothetical protein
MPTPTPNPSPVPGPVSQTSQDIINLAIGKFNKRLPRSAQQAWTYDNDDTHDYALLRDLIAALQQAQATIQRLEQEKDAAMRVLSPNMPESGLVDACKQVKQAAITAIQNCADLKTISGFCEAHQPTIPMPHRECPCCAAVERADQLTAAQATIRLQALVARFRERQHEHERNQGDHSDPNDWLFRSISAACATGWKRAADELTALLSAIPAPRAPQEPQSIARFASGLQLDDED